MKNAFKKLRIPTKKWIKRVQAAYVLEEHHDRLLILAGQAWDCSQQAKDIIDREGLIIRDRFKQEKQHPAADCQRQAMITFSRLLRELGLDLEGTQISENNRPPSRPGGYR